MAVPNFKVRRVKLRPEEYHRLRERVFQRDGYQCVRCGSGGPLQAHHLQFRSQQGGDLYENLISLCFLCHDKLHGSKLERTKLIEKLRGRESGNASCGTMTPLPDLVGP
jgi:5-methylcytosine-specific restriction endonuclease McrA